MDDMQLIVDFYKDADRLGPGSSEETGKALKLTGLNLNKDLNIADIGCGCGAQTLDLAKLTKGKIVAVDLFPEFLDKVKEHAGEEGVAERINTLQCSMESLPFEKNSLDLIWSEGAIYNMGFQKGLKAWHPFLKEGGYIAVSEITWLKEERPDELETFWTGAYSEMYTTEVKEEQLRQSGYELVASFTVSPESWMKNYYSPMINRMPRFLEDHHHTAEAEELVLEENREIDLFRKYKDYYGYVFYIGRKV